MKVSAFSAELDLFRTFDRDFPLVVWMILLGGGRNGDWGLEAIINLQNLLWKKGSLGTGDKVKDLLWDLNKLLISKFISVFIILLFSTMT